MKKLLFILILAITIKVDAQLKNMNQLVTYSTETYSQLESTLGKGYWKAQETGKMDSLTYTRWVPINLNEKNMGDCFMIFYKKKNTPINYIVYQTINKDTFQKYMVEIKKNGFKFASSDKKPDKLTDYYVKDKYGLSIIQGREKPTDAFMYIFGIRMLDSQTLKNNAAITNGTKTAPKAPVKK